MYKKLLSILFCFLALFSLTGCGNEKASNNKNDKVTVIDNENNTVELSYDELIDMQKNNGVKFEQYYKGATVEFTSKIKSITSATSCLRSDITYGTCNHIYFENGWIVSVLSPNQKVYNYKGQDYVNISFDLNDLDIGDTIKVKGKTILRSNKIYVEDIRVMVSPGGKIYDDYDNKTEEHKDMITFEKV